MESDSNKSIFRSTNKELDMAPDPLLLLEDGDKQMGCGGCSCFIVCVLFLLLLFLMFLNKGKVFAQGEGALCGC